MGCELAHKAVYYVWDFSIVFLCYIQEVYHVRAGNGISGWCSPFGCCTLHSYGFCMEYADKGESCIYGGAGSDK